MVNNYWNRRCKTKGCFGIAKPLSYYCKECSIKLKEQRANLRDYYDEGDICPKCKKGILRISSFEDSDKLFVICEDCKYDATKDIKEIKNAS